MRIRCLLLLLVASSLLHAGDQDFSGTWRLNESRSQMRAMPVLPARIVKIVTEGKSITCMTLGEDGQKTGDCSVSTDGKETRQAGGGRSSNSVAKWEGDALLINRLVAAGSSQHTEMDRWKLSHDGQTLTVRREMVMPHGEMESTLVYERVK
jgi:hypothetical protein